MAIQFPDFLNARTAAPDYSGIGDIVQNYYAGKAMPKDDLIKQIQAKFAQPNAEADLQGKNLKNIYQEIVNKFTPEDYTSQFAARKSLADMRGLGLGGMGGRAGVTAQQQLLLQRQLKRDNPNFTDEQAFEAAGNLVQGNKTLTDGTPFNVSGLTQLSAAKAVLQGTTAGLATTNTKAAQADAELGVLQNYAQSTLDDYGDTIGGYSPQQVLDTFKTDDDSQKRLGKFIASQALQYEIAQNRNRLAMGQPGVTSTQELMDMSGQRLKTAYPKLSATARREASNYMDKALRQGLKARQQIGILSSGLVGGVQNTQAGSDQGSGGGKTRLKFNPSTGGFE